MIPIGRFRVGTRTRFNESVGIRELSCWQPYPDEVWIQTRHPLYARKLSQITGGRLVMRGVWGGYLRTFAFHQRLAWAVKLIRRYISSEMSTNAHLIEPAASQSDFDSRDDTGDGQSQPEANSERNRRLLAKTGGAS
jgi:hypothetical protein